MFQNLSQPQQTLLSVVSVLSIDK